MTAKKTLQEARDLYDAGRFFDSEKLLKPVAESLEKERRADEEAADVFVQQGTTLKKLGQFEEAEKYLKRAQELYKNLCGEESHGYSEALRQTGMNWNEQNRFREANEAVERALEIRRKTYKAPHLEIAQVIDDLSEVAVMQGDHARALRLADEGLRMFKELGHEGEFYANCLENKAIALLSTAKIEDSEECLRQVLAIRRKCLPPGHASIANTMSNLTQALQRQHKFDGVEDMLKEAIDMTATAYGAYHPRTATFVNNLGGYYLEKGRLTEAAQNFERAVEIKEKTLGKSNPGLIKNLNNLAIVYKQLGRKDEAKKIDERLDSLMSIKISSDTTDVETMILLGDKLTAEKKYDEARIQLQHALKVAGDEFGPNSLKVANVWSFIANSWNHQGKYHQAHEGYVRVLRIQKKELGQKHPEVAATLRKISSCLQLEGQRDVADLVSLQAVAIEESAGVEEPHVAAMKLALAKLKETKGPRDPQVMSMMKLVITTCRMHGKHDEADRMQQEVLDAADDMAGPESLEVAHQLVTEAIQTAGHLTIHPLLRNNDGDPESVRPAIEMLEKALKLQERALVDVEDKDDIVQTLGHLSAAHHSLKEFDQAERYARQAVELVESTRGANSWALRSPLSTLQQVLKSQGREEEATAVEERMKGLPEADKKELDAQMAKMTKRMMDSLTGMFSGLAAISGDDESAAAQQLTQLFANQGESEDE